MAWIGLILCASDVSAHNVTVFAWVEGNTVHTESKFSGGRKAKNAPIEVYDSAGNLLLKGSTDDQGKFSFPIPHKTEMKVVLQAGMGHKAEWIIVAEDLEESDRAEAAPKMVSDSNPATSAPVPSADATDLRAGASSPTGPTAPDIEAAVEKALERKLQPVLKMLAESRQTGPDIRDILGGIGYIVGLVGLAAYLRYRRSKQTADPPAAGGESTTSDDH